MLRCTWSRVKPDSTISIPVAWKFLTRHRKSSRSAIRARNHTLKRALTDPRILSGIGNAYSDEILFEAKLSPFTLTQKLSDKDIEQLFAAIKRTLTDWVERLRSDAKDRFPEKVTAFRPDMATHGKYGEPCPRCGSKIQRIRYGSNETNYCPTCQTGGKLLADRALSRLLKRRLAPHARRTREFDEELTDR